MIRAVRVGRLAPGLGVVALVCACSGTTSVTASTSPSNLASQSCGPGKTAAFVDTGNTGRSVMAENVAQQFLAEKKWADITPISRGIAVDPEETSPETNAAELLAQRGINVSGHVATQLTAADANCATVILAVSSKNKDQIVSAFPTAKEKTFLLADYAVGTDIDIEDAYGKEMPAYRKVLAQLDEYVPEALTKVHERD